MIRSQIGLLGALVGGDVLVVTGQSFDLDHRVESALPVGANVLMVTQPRAIQVLRLDATTGRISTVGRQGDGPGEYQWPTSLHLAGRSRFGVIDTRSSAQVLWSFAGSGGDRRAIVPLAQASADSLGLIYGEATQIIPVNTEVDERPDTMPLVRRGVSNRVDTLAMLEKARRVVVGPFQGILPDFASDDIWGVLPDGTLWIARARGRRVEWRDAGSGRWQRVTFPWQPIPVAARERRALQVRVSVPPPGFDELRQPQMTTKGPFSDAVAGTDGSVWLRMNQPAGASDERYLIADRRSSALTNVRLPRGTEVVAITPSHVWVALETDEGLWRVSRIPRPSGRP